MILNEYPLPMSSTYLEHWSVENAVRELLQNALDSEGEFEYYWNNSGSSHELSITTLDVELCPSLLVLGNGTKAPGDGDRGGFGEGFKLALLVLERSGLEVEVINGGVTWTPVHKYSEQFKTNILHIEEREYDATPYGLTFVIRGLSEGQKRTIIERSLDLQDDIGKHQKTAYGTLLYDYTGQIYVGGLWVSNDSRLKYGYDFNPGDIPLNRDRGLIPDWDLMVQAQKVCSEALSLREIAERLNNGDRDVQLMPDLMDCPGELADVCFEVYQEEYGDFPAALWQGDADSMMAAGIEKVNVVGTSAFYDMLLRSDSYKTMLEKHEVAEEEEELTPLEVVENLYNMFNYCDLTEEQNKAFDKAIMLADDWS